MVQRQGERRTLLRKQKGNQFVFLKLLVTAIIVSETVVLGLGWWGIVGSFPDPLEFEDFMETRCLI
jgi:hypothetical protein